MKVPRPKARHEHLPCLTTPGPPRLPAFNARSPRRRLPDRDRFAPAGPTEIIEVHPLLWTEVLQMVLHCEIEDSMSAVAVLRTELLRTDGEF